MSIDVRVLDDNETRAHKNDGIDGVKYAILQLCAEIRGVQETLVAIENQRKREYTQHLRAQAGI